MIARMVDARAICLFTKQLRVEDHGIGHRNNQSATPTTKLCSCYLTKIGVNPGSFTDRHTPISPAMPAARGEERERARERCTCIYN